MMVGAGWMHILIPKFLDPLAEKKVPVINLHPALPKQYDGAKAIERAYDDYHKGKLKDDTTGIMIVSISISTNFIFLTNSHAKALCY
jgi:phosphoribosylglycinamide formyltransferase